MQQSGQAIAISSSEGLQAKCAFYDKCARRDRGYIGENHGSRHRRQRLLFAKCATIVKFPRVAPTRLISPLRARHFQGPKRGDFIAAAASKDAPSAAPGPPVAPEEEWLAKMWAWDTTGKWDRDQDGNAPNETHAPDPATCCRAFQARAEVWRTG